MYFVALLLCTYGLLFTDNPLVISVTTLAMALAFLLGGGGVTHKRSLVYVMVSAAALAVLLTGQPVLEVALRSRPFTLTVLLVVSVSMLSVLTNPQALLSLLGKAVAGFRDRQKPNLLMCSAAVASPFLNMATPVIYGHAFSGQASSDVQTAAMNIKRGMMVAMLIAPTFAPIAMVIGSHPDVVWEDALLYSVPLAVGTLVYYFASGKEALSLAFDSQTRESSSGLGWISLYVVLLLAAINTLNGGVIASIIVSAQATVLLALLLRRPMGTQLTFQRIESRCREATEKLSSEGLIFIASGVLLVTMQHLIQNDSLLYDTVVTLPYYLVIPAVILLLPLLSLANLHPIIGFTLVQPMVYLNQDLLALQKYLLWVCYWVVSLQISPISVINLTTSQAFGVEVGNLTDGSSARKVYLLAIFYSLLIISYGVISR